MLIQRRAEPIIPQITQAIESSGIPGSEQLAVPVPLKEVQNIPKEQYALSVELAQRVKSSIALTEPMLIAGFHNERFMVSLFVGKF